MNFVRRNLSEYKLITKEEEIPGNFTSVRGEYMDPLTKKAGFYKLNSSFWGQPDLRELLGSIILKSIGVPCADIELVYDDIMEKDNGCLSMSILKQGEQFVEQGDSMFNYDDNLDFGEGIDAYIARDFYFYKKTLPNVPQQFWDERKNFLINYVFISAFLGNDDIKTDNCQIIYNSSNGTFRNPEYYDMGMSFSGLSHGRTFYEGKSDKDVLNEIYSKYPEQAKKISQNISKYLTKDYIKGILQNKVFETLSLEERKRIWSELGDKITTINKYNEMLYGERNSQNGFTIGHDDLIEVSKNTPSSWKDKARRFVNNALAMLFERNGR